MAELVAVAFDEVHQADRALADLQRLQKEYLIDLEDAVVVTRDGDGKVRLKQSIDLTGFSAAHGGIWGGLWGSLVGLLFMNPLIGLVTGAAFGAGAGALSATLIDYGIDDNFIKSLGQQIKPNSSALFVLFRKVQPDKVLDAVKGYRGQVLRTSLSPQQEARLREALEGAQISAANAA